MAVTFLTGFDTGGVENAKSSGGTFSVQSSVANPSNTTYTAYALRCNPTTSATGFVGFGTVAATTGLPAFFTTQFYNSRFYFRIATAPAANSEQIMGCRTTAAGQNWAIRLDSARKLSLYNASNVLVTTGSTVLSTNTWYRIEIQADNTGATGIHLLAINGTQEWNTTCAQGTLAGEYVYGKSINRNSQTIDVYYDDIIINSSGNLPGEGRVVCKRMGAQSGTFDFNSGTNGSGVGEVQEVPADTTTYVMCAASATHDATFTSGANYRCIDFAAANTIFGLIMTCVGIREDTSGTSSITAQIKSVSSTQTNSTALNATTTPSNIAVLSTTNPSGGADWTRTTIDAASFGIVVGGTNAIAVRLSAVYVEIACDYNALPTYIESSSVVTVTLTAPTASASGDAVASADAQTITLSGPTASATGDAVAAASATTITLSGPTASATGSSSGATPVVPDDTVGGGGGFVRPVRTIPRRYQDQPEQVQARAREAEALAEAVRVERTVAAERAVVAQVAEATAAADLSAATAEAVHQAAVAASAAAVAAGSYDLVVEAVAAALAANEPTLEADRAQRLLSALTQLPMTRPVLEVTDDELILEALAIVETLEMEF